MIFIIFTILAFLSGIVLILHPLFSVEEYPENGKIICVILGCFSIMLGFYMLNNPL